MSATIASQEGWVQLKQSDMRLALNMVNIAKGGFSLATSEEMKFLIKNLCPKVQDGKRGGVEFRGHKEVKTAIERHPAMICQNHIA